MNFKLSQIISCLFTLFLSVAAFSQTAQPFTLNGDLSKLKKPVAEMRISYMQSEQLVTDSSLVTYGKYFFKGNIEYPVLAFLQAVNRGKDVSVKGGNTGINNKIYWVFLEPGKNITVESVDAGKIKVTGSIAHIEYEKLERQRKKAGPVIDSLMTARAKLSKKKDTPAAQKADALFNQQLNDIQAKIYLGYVKENPRSPLVYYALEKGAGIPFQGAVVKPVFEALDKDIRESARGKAISQKIEVSLVTAIGNLAPDFTQNDTLGNRVRLSDLRGKYVLLNFWASWCKPCRKESPIVINAFNRFKDKGFTVLSVSLDQSKEKWLKAIHDDGVGSWTHVSDLKSWNNAVAQLYGLTSVPSNFLLDPSGKIIASYSGSIEIEALEKKLEEVLE